MQLAALAAADLRLERGREEEPVLRQLQGLRAASAACAEMTTPVSRQWLIAA